LRREKKEVENEVPRKHEEVLWCPMSGLQQRLYRDIERGDVSADISLSSNTLMQLRKVCNHPFLFCLKTSLGFEIPSNR
jgi:SNF2 family DNA or RNA helicase